MKLVKENIGNILKPKKEKEIEKGLESLDAFELNDLVIPIIEFDYAWIIEMLEDWLNEKGIENKVSLSDSQLDVLTPGEIYQEFLDIITDEHWKEFLLYFIKNHLNNLL